MKKALGIILYLTLIAISFFFAPYMCQDTDIGFWSRLITFILLITTILILIKKFNVNVGKEFKSLLKFHENRKASEQSMRILIGGTLIPIFAAVFIFSPITSFTMVKLNASDYHESYLTKCKIVKTYKTHKRGRKYYVDVVYDGKPIKIPKEMKNEIDNTSQLPNLNRGRFGFYFIRD